MVITDLLKTMGNPYLGGNGDQLAAQAGSSNAGFYPMGMVADKNRMDAGKAPMPAPKVAQPQFDVNRLLQGLMGVSAAATGNPMAASGFLASPPPPQVQPQAAPPERYWDAVAQRWYTIGANGEKVWQDAPTDQFFPKPQEDTQPLINSSVVENAPWFGQEPTAPQQFSSPYSSQIDGLMGQEQAAYEAMMGRQAPHRQEFPMRPGAALAAIVAALGARALGAKPDMIGQVGQGFLSGMQGAADNRYANNVADYEQGMNADKLNIAMLDSRLKRLMGSEDDARNQFYQDRNFNEQTRQFNESLDQRDRASQNKFNASQATAINKQVAELKKVYYGQTPASAEDRNRARDEIYDITDGYTNLPPVNEDSVGYTKAMSQSGMYDANAAGKRIANDFATATFDDRVLMVGADLAKRNQNLQIGEQQLIMLTKTVENFPTKLRDDHLKATAAIGQMEASAHLASVKAKAGGFAPSSQKTDRVTIANQASAIKTVLSNNSSRIRELTGRLTKAQESESATAGDIPAIQADLDALNKSQADLKRQLSSVVGVNLLSASDEDVLGLVGQWATNPFKAIQDINGAIAERASNPPQPTVSAPGVSGMTLNDLNGYYQKNVKALEAKYKKGTPEYNNLLSRLNAKYEVEKARIQAGK